MREWSYASHSLSVSIAGATALRKSTLRVIAPLLCVIKVYRTRLFGHTFVQAAIF